MAVRFIIGRAGTGKTHYCLSAIRDQLLQDPIEGPRLIFVVPEQASLQMERTLLQPIGAPGSRGEIPGAHRAEVLSFQRLAYRVLDSAGASRQCALSEPARAMVIRHIVSRLAPRLRYYGRAAHGGRSPGRFGGFVDRLSATVAELLQEAVDPDQLENLCARPAIGESARDDEDPAGRAKLADLYLIYAAYLDYLGSDKLDPSQHLQAARESFPRCAWLRGAQVWVDGSPPSAARRR